jgi:hypothetical protein
MEEATPGSNRKLGSLALELGAIALLVAAICSLFQFPFDLAEGDEGWVMVFLAGGTTTFQWVCSRFLRQAKPC